MSATLVTLDSSSQLNLTRHFATSLNEKGTKNKDQSIIARGSNCTLTRTPPIGSQWAWIGNTKILVNAEAKPMDPACHIGSSC
ncbi:unnamed protein product [Aspergillus oryzae]|uniref:Unnamed protein product n=1 Tax=Aspergillus oryzae TaxID=5062 RepID=A0AAN4YNZ2_ASPOZ|nr:unnamed protein product [Aspergillus oryzae]GMF97143.1 unnamed protein product [Aspergillus oryzae]GMG08681.1 unnamed protein product [Aspergillus oryzae]GMG33246.1 unnamed protein product [Aspergillus oryzae]